MVKIAVIGTGPTGIYTLQGLIPSPTPLDITLFEAEPTVGKGMPYHPALNDKSMLSNIASIEIPPVCESLVDWLFRQGDEQLQRMNIARTGIDERTFYPRVVLGDYFQAQLLQLIEMARVAGHQITVRAPCRVTDIALREGDIRLTCLSNQEDADSIEHHAFDHVVLATGHSWPDNTQTKPGYFISPWPADVLASIGDANVGILGTSLSGIDAVVALATQRGMFYRTQDGTLEYQPGSGTERFSMTMMSRKGLLPEADFYCPIPYEPLSIVTDAAIDALIESGRADLLDATYALFCEELSQCDPDYAADIGLSMLPLEKLSDAYFAARSDRDAFEWAARNLAEAQHNLANRHTVAWRYAILRMHEPIARIVPALNARDLKRFHRHFKVIFVDDYATVPHESIERLLALHRAGRLDIMALGSDYDIDTEGLERGAVVVCDGQRYPFDAFVDATGQHTLDAGDIPFPSLLRQGVVNKAEPAKPLAGMETTAGEENGKGGGIAVDDAFRLVFDQPLSNRLYCVSLPFLLHTFPFVQGITSAWELGSTVASAILAAPHGPAGAQMDRPTAILTL